MLLSLSVIESVLRFEVIQREIAKLILGCGSTLAFEAVIKLMDDGPIRQVLDYLLLLNVKGMNFLFL